MTVPPCFLDPQAWDADHGQRPNLERIDALVQVCRTQCPLLDTCSQLDRGDAYGVVAGQYRPWPSGATLATAFRQVGVSRVADGITATAKRSKPGTVLPSAAALARLYGVSETTVRSALLSLARQDVLTQPVTRSQWFRVPQRTETAA